MAAVVSGTGLGLFNSSGSTFGAAGSNGDSAVGPGRDQLYVNSTTGNLIIQALDERVAGNGIDSMLVRTYNSQGRFDGYNDDHCRVGGYRSMVLTGALNDPASTITKTFGDGAEVVYRPLGGGV